MLEHDLYVLFIRLRHEVWSAKFAFALRRLGSQDVTAVGGSALDFASAGDLEPFLCGTARLHFWHECNSFELSFLCLCLRGSFHHGDRLSLRVYFLFPFGGQDHNHASPLHVRFLVDLRIILQSVGQLRQHLISFFLVGDFPAFEHDRRLHLVPFQEELPGMTRLEIEIVNVRIGMKPQLFQQRNVLVLLLNLVFLREFIFELAEVDNLANRRCRIGNDLNQISFSLTSKSHRHLRGHDAQLRAVLVNDANFRVVDLLIYPRTFLFADGRVSDVMEGYCEIDF